MDIEGLKSLRFGDVVVALQEIDGKYLEGEEFIFLDIWDRGDYISYNFLRLAEDGRRIVHFRESVCECIERDIVLKRDSKLGGLGI